MEEKIRHLNTMIMDNFDIIWQEDWFDFEDEAYALVEECVEYGGQLSDDAGVLARALYRGGDAPSQECWYDICDAVCTLSITAYNERVIGLSALDEFPMLYGTD